MFPVGVKFERLHGSRVITMISVEVQVFRQEEISRAKFVGLNMKR